MASNNCAVGKPGGSEYEPRLDSLIKTYLAASSIRPELLFRKFLPTGYRLITIDSVDADMYHSAILAKVHLGMMITLYDDLADNPQYRNPDLLSALYGLNIGNNSRTPPRFSGQDRLTFELARHLFSELRSALESFPHHAHLEPALRFDIEQFYACNRHSELMALLPNIRNLTESQILGPHNMGIVAAGTIDLMASAKLRIAELGQCREVFHLGQRLGRISNLIFTQHREAAEGDTTNEILISHEILKKPQYRDTLLREFEEKKSSIRSHSLQTFQTAKYAEGLQALHQLHSSLEGKI